MKKMFKFFTNLIINTMTGWLFLFKELFTNLFVQGIFMTVGSIFILLYLFNRALLMPAVRILIPLYFIWCITKSLFHISSGRQGNPRGNYSEQSQKSKEETYTENIPNFFFGMNKEQAKQEYKRLLKIYHPDNTQTGNADMAKAIISQYRILFG